MEFSKIAKYMIFFALHCHHFESGWELLTTAAHSQKWLINKKKYQPYKVKGQNMWPFIARW